MITTVVHRNKDNFDILIDRGTDYGNPFIIGIDGNRKEVIEKYSKYLFSNNDLMEKIELLRGKRLGCWCKPKPCHGDVIVSFLETSQLIV